MPPKNPEPTETTKAPTGSVSPTKQPDGTTTKPKSGESTGKPKNTKPLGTTPLPTTTVNPKLVQHNQKLNPYFPDFPSANPNSLPPPPLSHQTNGRDGERGSSEGGPYLSDRPMRPPPHEQNYPNSRPRPRPYDEPPRRPFQMDGYGFGGPPRAPPPPPSRDRPSYEGGLPIDRHRPPPPPSRDDYPPRERWGDRDRGHRNEGHSHKALVSNHEGHAGDLGDLPTMKINQASNAISPDDTLYGKRTDTRPKVAQNETVEKPFARSVTWAFHEDVMNKEHAFNEQYKDFETMDEAINQKHKKKVFKSPSKPDKQVKANVRSWNINRDEMVKKMAKEQYEDFEKTNVQIAQDMASKHYRDQYDGFEAFKSATANQNGNETKEETEPANQNEALIKDEPAADNQIPTNPSEATKQDTAVQPIIANEQQPISSPITTTKNNPVSTNNLTPTNNVVSPSNTSIQSTNQSKPIIETDDYKQYMNAINNPEDSFPNFPNATTSKSTLLNETNLLLNQPIEPSVVSNVSYGISSTNSSILNSTVTTVPVRAPTTNPIEPVINNSIVSPLSTITSSPLVNASSPLVNTTLPSPNTTLPPANTTLPPVNTILPSTNTTTQVANTTIPLIVSPSNSSLIPVNIPSSAPATNTNSTQINTTTTTTLPTATIRKTDIHKEAELSRDTMAMKRTATSYPDNIIKNLLLLKDRLTEEVASEHKHEGKPEDAERKEKLHHHHHHKLKQISGPPNFSIQKRIPTSSSSSSRTGMQRATVMDLPTTTKSEHLELKNLTGVVKLNNDAVTSDDDGGSSRSLEKIDKEGEGSSKVASTSASSPIVEMVKSGAISLEENDSKDFFKYLISALKNKSVESLPPITRTQKNDDHKLRTIPNPYDFVVPETKKFILEGEELNEERLMEILGEHAITTRQKQRQLEQRRRISQIKNQALSKRIPLMGHFSTSQLKDFKLQSEEEDEDETTSFLKSLEPIVKMMTKNGSSILDSLDTKDTNTDKKKNSIKNALRSFIKKNKMMHQQKRQNLKNVNQPLFTVQQNMADMIKIWQNTMDDVPGLTDENRKIDESGGTANETIENIKNDQKKIKEKVNEDVDNQVDELKQKTQKVVQENNPSRRDGYGGGGKDHIHQVFATVKAGTDRLREKLKHKLYEKMFDYNHMHDDNFDFKGNVPRIPKNQEEIKKMLNEEMESVISGQRNISRKLDSVFEKAISQFPKNGSKKDLVTATQEKIQEDAKKVSKKVDEVIQKAQQQHLDTLNRVLNQPTQGQIVEHHINAESLPGLDKRSNITLPSNKRHFHFEQKSKKTLQALKNYLHLSWKHGAASHNSKINAKSKDFKKALAKLFFDDEKQSKELLRGIFPEPLKSDLSKQSRQHQHQLDGKTLGSRARSFRASILKNRKRGNRTSTKTTATGMKRINKRDGQNTLRGLIPSAIGDMSPSSEHPTIPGKPTIENTNGNPTNQPKPTVENASGNPTVPAKPTIENPTIQNKPAIENIKEKEKATTSTDENTLAQPWDHDQLHALIKLQNDYNNLKAKLLKQQMQQKNKGANSDKEKPKENTGSVGTSPEDENIPPVGEDGKPPPNSGPQEDHRSEEEKQGDPEKEKEKENTNHQESGESGKDELGSHLLSKIRNDKTKDSKNDNSFEAGLTDGVKNVESPIDKLKQDNNNTNDNTKQEDSKPTSDQQQKLKESPTLPETNEPPQPPQANLDESNKQNQAPPVNVTALELGIIKLLNDTNPVQHAKTKHGKQMEELNMKYEALKLPIENGEFWPTQINKNKKKLKNDQKDKEKAGSNDSGESVDENMPTIIDATPTESSPTADYLMQRLKLMELSSLLSANNKNNKTSSASSPQPVPAELKLDDDLTTTNATPDGPDEMTIQLPSQPSSPTLESPSPSMTSSNKSENVNPEMSQTPAELAKKLVDHLKLNNNKEDRTQSTPLQPSEQVQTTPPTTTPSLTTASITKETDQAPVIPVPMDSKLGKMLYPNSNDVETHNTSTSLVFDGNKESINTKIDGMNYTSVLVDKTKELLENNMIRRKDLIDLLQSAHVLDNLKNLLPPNEQKDALIESLSIQPDARSTVTKTNREKNNKEVNEQSIHITLQKKNGLFYLIPNHNEAYQKNLVPQEIGLVPYKKKT